MNSTKLKPGVFYCFGFRKVSDSQPPVEFHYASHSAHPPQVIHKHTGLLAHSIEGTAYQIRFLLSNPALAGRLGQQGHEHVREHFLITSNIKAYLTLFLHLLDRR